MKVREKLGFWGVIGPGGGDMRENERIRILGCEGVIGSLRFYRFFL